MTRPVDVWTDGACKHNPGPGGWGAVLVAGDVSLHLWGGTPETTNNQMELTAAIRALERLERRVPVRLHTDSTYVMKGIQEWIHNWKKRGWKTAAKKPVLNADLWRRLDELTGQHEVEWRWVKGHSGDAGNELADALANRGVEQFARRGLTGADEERST